MILNKVFSILQISLIYYRLSFEPQGILYFFDFIILITIQKYQI
jgi:hypothetical protein